MLHLIRSDIYKLKKSRYFWVCLIITVALAVGSVFLINFSYNSMGDKMETKIEQQKEVLDESGANISIENVPVSQDELSGSGQLVSFFTGNTLIIMAVFLSLFIGSEFNHRTMKNIASRQYSRRAIYLSKLITGILTGVGFTLIYAFCSELTAIFLWGFGDVPSGFWPETLGAIGLELLLLCAFLSVFTMFAFLIRQNGGALAVNICFLEFLYLIVMLGEMMLEKLTGKTIALSNYLIDANMSAITAGLDRTLIIRSLFVSAGFFLAALLIGMINFQKRDIK